MLIADTSVWVDHFRHGHEGLAERLTAGLVLMHPFVLGELACGSLKDRSKILQLLAALPPVKVATHAEVMAFVDMHKLWSRGIGWIDVHLLASARLSGCGLWTLDGRLADAAEELGVG